MAVVQSVFPHVLQFLTSRCIGNAKLPLGVNEFVNAMESCPTQGVPFASRIPGMGSGSTALPDCVKVITEDVNADVRPLTIPSLAFCIAGCTEPTS